MTDVEASTELLEHVRSPLYVPANRPERCTRAVGTGADAVLVDLEDSVPGHDRDVARNTVRQLLETHPTRTMMVRINAGAEGRRDLAALRTMRPPAGLVLAKCESVGWLDEVATALPSIPLVPLVESARAVRSLDALCTHENVVQCHLGEIDLAADLGAFGGGGRQLVADARRQLVFASAAAGILPPIGGVFEGLDDLSALEEESALLAQYGFGGRPAIHPKQIDAINRMFTPTAEEVRRAEDTLAALARGSEAGAGALRAHDGTMIDEASARAARRILARAARAPEVD